MLRPSGLWGFVILFDPNHAFMLFNEAPLPPMLGTCIGHVNRCRGMPLLSASGHPFREQHGRWMARSRIQIRLLMGRMTSNLLQLDDVGF